jgi:hypothetical protein
MRRQRPSRSRAEELPLSFASPTFMSLMLAILTFFVVMDAQNPKKGARTTGVLNAVAAGMPSIPYFSKPATKKLDALSMLQKRLEKITSTVSTDSDGARSILIEFPEPTLFRADSADILPMSVPMIETTLKEVAGGKLAVQITIRYPFDSAIELELGRSAALERFALDLGIPVSSIVSQVNPAPPGEETVGKIRFVVSEPRDFK